MVLWNQRREKGAGPIHNRHGQVQKPTRAFCCTLNNQEPQAAVTVVTPQSVERALSSHNVLDHVGPLLLSSKAQWALWQSFTDMLAVRNLPCYSSSSLTAQTSDHMSDRVRNCIAKMSARISSHHLLCPCVSVIGVDISTNSSGCLSVDL